MGLFIQNRMISCMAGLIFLCNVSLSQVIIQFAPAINGQTINGLFRAQLQNNSLLSYNGRLKISVKDGGNNTVVTALTPSFLLKPGNNFLQTLVGQSNWQFGNSSASKIVAQTGRFTENDYEYCFEFIGTENKPGADEHVFENCYTYNLQPVFPMTLVYPGDGDILCQTRPGFHWQAPVPGSGNYVYHITVVEKKDKQDMHEAIINNVPVFQQQHISGATAYFPPQLPELQKQKTYAWQVEAYQGETRITESEIWTFTVNCDTRKTDSSKDSYRQLSTSLDGNYYTADGALRFSIINPYGLAIMQYTLIDLSDPTNQIRNIPTIKIHTGLNRIDLPLEDISGLSRDKMYLLKVLNIGDRVQYLQFIYKENENQ